MKQLMFVGLGGALAIVVLGGLISSTFLNLFVVPAGYSLVFSRRPVTEQPSSPKFSLLTGTLAQNALEQQRGN